MLKRPIWMGKCPPWQDVEEMEEERRNNGVVDNGVFHRLDIDILHTMNIVMMMINSILYIYICILCP
jgi:hypothetical protein